MNIQQKYVELLREGPDAWNGWRSKHPKQTPSLRGINFANELSEGLSYPPEFFDIDFSNVDLHMSSLRDCYFKNCCLDNAKMTFTDLVGATFVNCTFRDVSMRVSKIGNAEFNNCIFEFSDLSYCSAEKTSFAGSKIIDTELSCVEFVASDFSDTELIGCNVYGISSWDLNLERSIQKDLVITKKYDHPITVDDIELAQFMYLMISNTKLRNIIDTITSKVVLILGNFSPERKVVLDKIKEKIRYYDYIPIMFDFEKPSSRDLTETVSTLAHMAKFVIADLSSPRCIGHELMAIIPQLSSVTIYPLIVSDENEYAMFNDFSKKYSWVKGIIKYEDSTIGDILEKIIDEQKT